MKELQTSFVSLLATLRANLLAFDVYTVIIMTIYSILALAFYPYVSNAAAIILQNALIATTIAALVLLTTLTSAPLFVLLRMFYIIPVIYIMYGQVHALVPAVHPVDYDDVLIAADRLLTGGVDPTVWMGRLAMPALTEYLQICYFLFYVLPILQAVELYRQNDLDRLAEFARAMSFCYFISYLAYFAMPAIGPRFTLHDFHRTDIELPGVFLTTWLRDIVNAGGGVAIGTTNPEHIVNRDCMPSGHTMLTLVNIVMAFRNRSRLRWLFVVIGGSLIIATVYLRYHYVVDLIIGAVFAVVFLAAEPTCNRFLIKKLQKVSQRM